MMTRPPIHRPTLRPAATLLPAAIPGRSTGAAPTKEIAR
jgi:hypothetical protein